ncbi:MAG: acyl-CoA dehydratase activase-related protein [Oscillospiraceae bacterium]|nr:acyl-CoA dehydratase activase-related protein [Oscillospiraceae bacterium]
MKRLGLDIGSTTIKCVVLGEQNEILFSSYERHLSKIAEMTAVYLRRITEQTGEQQMLVTISGSAGMGLAEALGVPFAQEVYSTRMAVTRLNPETDVVIELGGEDAKILFLTGGFEARMNGSCAGGTGAFIDQMATLIGVTPDELNRLAEQADKIYTIASRCGVFAKSDIQPLLNQGAGFPNIAASILKAVVNQTVGGLAQGREIAGNILYLGGPLTYLDMLRKSFDETLKLQGICPEHALYYVAYGAALQCGTECFSLTELAGRAEAYTASGSYMTAQPLFASQEDYDAFCTRHKNNSSHIRYIDAPQGDMYLGIDAGSTTIKAAVTDADGNILDTIYQSNKGNPVPVIRDYLTALYEKYPGIRFAGSAVTGYGEDIIREAFGIDFGIVETIAHYTAAKKFKPDVDFIIDIGGQDIKCFRIHNHAIDNIFLNEACSSGCGSFLQTFAEAMHYSIADFAKLGLFADQPVDLGSRCTVFMNSSVKQAQKDGASVENISAGLSMSVVKNALYKVIRCANASELGRNIVVQGGTFLNDAVLRAFEMELKQEVVRPEISGIMGAYGAALYAKQKASGKSRILNAEQLRSFTHTVRTVTCKGCNNRCQLTVNSFGGDHSYIAGNRCEKPLRLKSSPVAYNLYEEKRNLLKKYRQNRREDGKPTVGIPLALNIYELLPFWHTLFEHLGFNVLVSPDSTRKLYLSGQHTIPSDTICFPAKLLHGHMEALLSEKPDLIFYPCMSYNVDEKAGDNHYNCPVVAYYPEVANINIKALKDIPYLHDFVGIHNKKTFPSKFRELLRKYGYTAFSLKQVREAAECAYREYDLYMNAVRKKAEEFLEAAKQNNLPVIVLAGRPYHIDPEVNHALDKLICGLGAVVITEDSIACRVDPFRTTVLNQWTYHARLYLAARFVAESLPEEHINLVQFVSFGCGVDAVTTDEVRSILEKSGKIYTQLKIDEVTNAGAAKIRLRSLFAAAGLDDLK